MARFLFSVLLLFAAGLLFLNTAEPQTGEKWPGITTRVHVRGLTSPTHITHAGDGSNRLFVTEQRGRIMIVKSTTVAKTPFLDITGKVSCCGERGLLSIAFPPGYRDKRYFYINYTNKSGDTVIARYQLSADPDRADSGSEEILLTIKQPYANHNGGQLAFGPDGYLYIGMGDGGSRGDPHNNGQNPAALLGKILRIDVESGASPYAVPKNNPYMNKRGYRPEIWALGLRNPWRFSFDRKTGDLYIADVGQELYEEIDFQPASSRGGENYGWNIMEGNHCYRPAPCDRSGLTAPVAEYDHSQGCSVTGGMVYRGPKFPQLQGIYFYADYCSGRIWGLRRSRAAWQTNLLSDTDHAISTFGEDEAGNLYFADHRSGTVYAIDASSS
ncbi:MAG: PQQ-dependent sugar dehydrogenase [Nitrospirota bacterium]